MFHVIDDERMLRDLLGQLIIVAGYNVLCFESGEKYLKHLNSPEFEQPIAVFSDVVMPGMNGYELVLQVRRRYPQQKIVLITGSPEEYFCEDAAKQLCYSLDKPFRAEQLHDLLANLANCEDSHHNNDYCLHCDFNMDHDCPFHDLKSVS